SVRLAVGGRSGWFAERLGADCDGHSRMRTEPAAADQEATGPTVPELQHELLVAVHPCAKLTTGRVEHPAPALLDAGHVPPHIGAHVGQAVARLAPDRGRTLIA